MRNPLTGFPSAGQPTGLSGLPFLILLDHQGFRPLGRATKGAAFGICQPFEKGWTENFLLPTLRGLLSGGRGFTRGIWPQDMCCTHRTGLRPMGNPLTGFPSAGQPGGLSGLPFLIFWGSFRDFALCGGRPKALPLESASLLKKAGPKT